MKAVVIKAFGGADNLHLVHRSVPKINSNEVLIKVAAAGLNRADVAQRKGHYPAPKGVVQDIPGLEVSGVIEATGADVAQWEVGQDICALLPGGGYAEYVAVDAGSCFSVPKNFSLQDAAALPEVLLTVWQNIFQIGKLQKGEKVLIYGGSGGIGSMAIQLTKLFGAHPLTLASSPKKVAYCQNLGAEQVMNYKTENILDAFGKNSIALILDSVGGKYLDHNINLLQPEGRLVYINAMGGGHPQLDIFKMMQKRLIITGSTLRSRSYAHKKNLIADMQQQALPLLERNDFKNMVSHRFPVEEVVEAHRLMDSRNFLGKIILQF